jgi:small-conductance mechanosensitive channel
MRNILWFGKFAVFLLILCLSGYGRASLEELPLVEENKKLAETSGNPAASATYGLVAGQVKLAELANADALKYSASIDKFIEQVEELNQRYQNALKIGIRSPDSIEEFDLLFGQLDAENLRLQKRQTDLNQLSANIANRATQIPEEIQALNKEEAGVPTSFALTGNIDHDDAITQLRSATLSRIAAQREALEMERLSSKNRLELLRKELRLLDEQMQQLAQIKHDYQLRRQSFANDRMAQLRRDIDRLAKESGANSYLQSLAAEARDLMGQWRNAEDEWRSIMKRRETLEESLTALAAEKQNFENELTVSSASAMIGVPLMERYENSLRAGSVNEDALKEAHLQRLKLNTSSMVARNRESGEQIQRVLREARFNDQQKAVFEQLLEKYNQIFNATAQAYDDLILELIKYQGIHADMVNRAQELRRLITKNSLWVSNVSAIDGFWLKQVVESVVLFANAFRIEVPRDFSASFNQFSVPHWYLPLALFALFIRYMARRRFVRSLDTWAATVGNVKHDRINQTLYVVGCALLLSALWVAPFFLFGHYLIASDSGSGYLQAIGATLLSVSRFLFVVRFLIFSSLPNSFFLAHLRFPETLVRSFLKALRVAEWVGALLVAACVLTSDWPDPLVVAGVGRLLFFLLALFVSAWIWFIANELCRIGKYLNMRSHWMGVVRFFLPLLPLISALCALFGYFFLARILLVNAYQTLSVLLIVLLVFMIFRRVFAIHERRLAYGRAIAHREEERAKRKKASEESSSEVPIDVEDFEVDTTVLRSRSMSLLQLAAFAVFVVAVMQIWSDFLLAFDWMNSVALWESVKTVGSNQVVDVVTLSDVLEMIIIFVVTVFLAINLPSLIELLLLQNIRLEPGVGFAVMTVTSYVVVIVGVLAGFAAIGMDWSKMQWLVAALGLGVGFGLQEVVANFVSGLILLFERPIRLGDLITVQGADRREIVVPNKILLSEKITNWSLTDGMTRVVIPIGVSYGSDVDQVTRLLLQVAKESPLVQKTEPPPEAFFIGFGNSTLDFELRVYTTEIGRRMPATHDLHSRILVLFRQNDIDIAYPQMDLHIVNLPRDSEDLRSFDNERSSDEGRGSGDRRGPDDRGDENRSSFAGPDSPSV